MQKGYVKHLKERLDVLLVKKGFYQSRERAKASIMAGIVYVDGQKSDKAGNMIDENAEITVKENICPYVSRGGLKLEKSMKLWPIDLKDAVCMDIGASTGGFTDCLLQHGAKKVYAVDVGHNQLHEKLRSDPRVISHEGCNLRTAPEDLIPEKVDLVVADVSFISLTLILPPCMRWLKEGGLVATLIKPQFEVGPSENVRGVVKSEAVRQKAVNKILVFAKEELGLENLGVVPAAIKGPKGNQEYMALFRRQGN